MVQRVAIIGAGASGLASIKCCLDEGLEPTCFEQSHDIGGLWRFTEAGRISVYRSVITNTSKEMMCFSDFPFPEDFPNYMNHSRLLEYFRMYAERFSLLRYIRFETTVHSVRKCPDFSTTGQWDVFTETDGTVESAVFDAVMVCSGHYAEPHLPLDSFPGIENCFRGQYLHSWEYKDSASFQGKRVLVLGVGNSGGDIAVEISRVAAQASIIFQVFLSTRSGTWVISRISDHGFPLDMMLTTRFHNCLENFLPSALMRRLRLKKFNTWFDHANYGLIPQKSPNLSLIVNDELPSCILCGAVVVKPNVEEFMESSAVFEDGTVEENIDMVVFATGYTFSFPFLEESVRNIYRSKYALYKYIFPPPLEKPTLAVLGLIELTGSIMAGTELQARWATRVFKGLNQLPPASRLMAEVAKKQQHLIKQGLSNKESKIKMSYIGYMDEIASCVGVKPNVLLLFLKDPKLALEVFFGPCTPCQYRLAGPGKWVGARNTILTQWHRALKPLRTRVINDSSNHSLVFHWLTILGLPALLCAGLLICKYSPQLWFPRVRLGAIPIRKMGFMKGGL
ncbi:dimethylaniline monooxygenase [N-oxide-forming] 4-like isoform X1 [Terrapene carolina triunguis]|uniref:dimethylaniline monooxygenase [N-oxide-forming] 4-like isoform X1 n=2 Tax=Terrapene triunguis TaxID=2587831 RepID=UPI000CEF8F48|nr:dimethylaniline monooxygenase [N-oxide-forming] 4-like isoform X1 [Terrapene carolina triunguis]